MVHVYGICICIWYMYMVYVYGNEPRPRGASFGPRVPAARYHIHIPYTYTIYIYHIHVPYTCTIYMYHIHVPYTYTIYIYHIHTPYTICIYHIHIPYAYVYGSCVFRRRGTNLRQSRKCKYYACWHCFDLYLLVLTYMLHFHVFYILMF